MSREKQNFCERCLHYRACLLNSEYVPSPCSCYEDKAEYRKASDVAEEIFAEIEKYIEVALMNGHIETPILCIGHGTFAELKKKYTEEGK